jgi:hypothetical protein
MAVEIPTAVSRDSAPTRNAATAASFSALGISSASNECVVADAVAIEPVSTTEFAAIREKNREFIDSGMIFGPERSKSPQKPGLRSQIPYAPEQGILGAEQGILDSDQGFLSNVRKRLFFAPSFDRSNIEDGGIKARLLGGRIVRPGSVAT